MEASAATGNSNRWQLNGLPFPSSTSPAFGGAFRNYGAMFNATSLPRLNFHIAVNSTSVRAYNGTGTLLSNTAGITLTETLIVQGFYKTDV